MLFQTINVGMHKWICFLQKFPPTILDTSEISMEENYVTISPCWKIELDFAQSKPAKLSQTLYCENVNKACIALTQSMAWNPCKPGASKMFVNLSQPRPYNQRWHIVDHLLFTWRNVRCAGIIVVIISARMRVSRPSSL